MFFVDEEMYLCWKTENTLLLDQSLGEVHVIFNAGEMVYVDTNLKSNNKSPQLKITSSNETGHFHRKKMGDFIKPETHGSTNIKVKIETL